MSVHSTIFDHSLEFDPAGDLEAFLKLIPGKWVVYLFVDAQDNPIQLLCVKNLRASLKRRLGGEEMIGPTKRVNYRELVRRIYWRRVDSRFEADWVYLEAARQVFPDTYQGMVGFRPAWFVHVNPRAQFPRYVKTQELGTREGRYLGPVEDKHAAARLIALAEDAFDLCRYYNILIEAPHGRACPYKEMGKCPAPCDGSIPMEQYRAMVQQSATALIDPADVMRQQTRRMQQAATELRFEDANRLKAQLDKLAQLGKGAFRHVCRLEDFAFLSVQRGPWAGTAKLFLITAGQIDEVAGLIGAPTHPADVLRVVLERNEALSERRLDTPAIERLGVVAQHLFAPAKQASGVFLRLAQIDEKGLLKAYRDLQKQKTEDESEAEGVVKELQGI